MKQRVALWKIGVVVCSAALVTGFVVYRAAGREKPVQKTLMPGTKRMEIVNPDDPRAKEARQRELMSSSKSAPIVPLNDGGTGK